MNVSKSGVSTSIGKPGATLNVNKDGVQGTAGIPGTGVSVTKASRNRRAAKAEGGSSTAVFGVMSVLATLVALFKPKKRRR